MKTATLRTAESATVTATYTRSGSTLRVSFQSCEDGRDGFTVAELDALEVAIGHARRHLLEHQHTPTLRVFAPHQDRHELDARYRKQLEQMQPVPT